MTCVLNLGFTLNLNYVLSSSSLQEKFLPCHLSGLQVRPWAGGGGGGEFLFPGTDGTNPSPAQAELVTLPSSFPFPALSQEVKVL